MPAKRAAPSSASEVVAKKAKAAPKATKAAAKPKAIKASKATAAADDSPLDSVKQAASTILNTVSDAVKVAGDVLLDDGEAAPASEVLNENVDVPALKKKGKAAKGKAAEKAVEVKKVAETKVAEAAKKAEKASKPVKGKAAKAAQDAEAAVEKKIEEKTGIDVKAVKGKAGKAAKAVKDAAEAAEAASKNPKNRKKAEDFMAVAEETVKKIAGKVGEVLEESVEQFGEASGLAESIGKEAKKGKKQAVKKGKEVAGQAEEVAKESKKAAGKKGAEVKEAGKRKAKAAVEEVAAAAEPEEDEDVYMHGFSSSDGEADSSDDESDAEDLAVAEAGRKVDMSSLPMVAKDDLTVQARLKKASKKKDTQKGTLYLGRIPHGFYEEQMKEYFSQFGDVSRLRLARNRKTGASRHYAYIEMSSQSVAEIVADTMNNYLLMGHILKCHVIPADKVHPQLWVGANKKFRKIPRARVELKRHDKERTEEEQAKADKKLLKKEGQRKKKLEKAGIDYEFEGHAQV
ncbi:hypothetical protein IAT38_007597 [Cryptococcus sp. DSM 104549]